MREEYIYDKDKVRFRRVRNSMWKWARRGVLFIIATMSMTVLYYVLFALLFSTETERRLKAENDMYERELPELERKERLLADVVDGLKLRDDRIYEAVFHASAPEMDPMSSVDFLAGIDSVQSDNIVHYVDGKLDRLDESAARVEDNFRKVMDVIRTPGFVMPPMTNPVRNLTFAQTGASVGDKINPFYKVSIRHDGLDILAHSGEPVYASADGVVSDVVHSKKGLGNVVTIEHKGGYVTRYAHLADIEVRKGRKVSRGTRIGYVGVSGNSFAPHLHYEVRRDTLVLDPVNHFFASVSPQEYMNMVVMSLSTGQSMD